MITNVLPPFLWFTVYIHRPTYLHTYIWQSYCNNKMVQIFCFKVYNKKVEEVEGEEEEEKKKKTKKRKSVKITWKSSNIWHHWYRATASLQICHCLSSGTHRVRGEVSQKPYDRQRIDNFIRRSVKSGFCLSADLQPFEDLREKAEDELFNQVLNNPLHVLPCCTECRAV